jgi:hypothetical protein
MDDGAGLYNEVITFAVKILCDNKAVMHFPPVLL